jgi:hypothetical protein
MADPNDPNKPTVTMTEDQLKKLLRENNQNRTPPASAKGFDIQRAVELAGNGIEGMKKLVTETADTWRDLSNTGIGFNNDAVGLRTSIAKTRLGTEEYGDVINRAKLGLTSLGGSMSEGAKAFNRLSDDFSRSEAADRLSKLGYSTKEFNEVLALSVTGKRFDAANDKEASKKARDSAEELAVEMDKVAQLTGVSRRDQMEALQAQQRDARLQAAFELEIRNGGKQVADDYRKASTNLQGLGLDKLGKELFTGQALSEKAIATMNALGPAGTQLREAMNATRLARTDEQRQAAGILMQNAQAAVAARVQQDSYLQLVRAGQGVVADAAGEQYIAAKNYTEALEAVRADALKEGKSLNDQEAAEAARQRVALAQSGKDKEGKDIAGAKTTELAIQAQNRLKDAYVVSAEIIEALNNNLGRGATIKGLIDKTRNVKMDENGVKTSFTDRFGEQSLQKLITSINNDTIGKDLPALIKAGFKETIDASVDIGKTVGGGILDTVVPGFKSFIENIKEMFPDMKAIKEAVQRDTGTLGKTGQLTEPKDILTSVEAGETVFTPTQLDNFARNVAESAKTQMPPEFTSVLRSMQLNTGTAGTSSGIDLFADMFKNIQTSISPANAPSKNPADQSSVIFSDRVAEQNARIVEAIGKLSTPESTKETAPTVDFANVFDGLFKGLQTEIPKFGETIKTSFGNLASVIPSAQQNRTTEMSRTIPAEISQARLESQRQEENRKRESAQQNTTIDNNQQPKELKLAGTATLDDLKDLLEQLNSTMGINASHLSELINSTDKQVRATKRLDPNVTMRS